ncbi:MAG TPA: phosphotransferase, partial [Vicinamibacterales bacterium]|nr:phosphotransferase [Vicinamibacterales bacterium]
AQARIDRYLEQSGLAARQSKVVALTGDASTRRYFRIIPSDGPSLVLALHDGPIEFATLPFAAVARLLSRMPLPVPDILGHADALGVLELEDLGDVTLQSHLGAGTPTEHEALYRQAVAFIGVLQVRGAELLTPSDAPAQLAFDVEKLTWEMEFFVRHFIEGYRGAILTAAHRNALSREWAEIVEELAGEPRVLCHRDYHSRNLMVHDGQLYMIDFQDARMGPDTYDLASLLRDSYVDITALELDSFIAYFAALRGIVDAVSFRRRFDLMALQRNLKALGTFGYQAAARRNPIYIQYIPRTLRYVRDNLDKYSRFGPLRELLATHIEELE